MPADTCRQVSYLHKFSFCINLVSLFTFAPNSANEAYRFERRLKHNHISVDSPLVGEDSVGKRGTYADAISHCLVSNSIGAIFIGGARSSDSASRAAHRNSTRSDNLDQECYARIGGDEVGKHFYIPIWNAILQLYSLGAGDINDSNLGNFGRQLCNARNSSKCIFVLDARSVVSPSKSH